MLVDLLFELVDQFVQVAHLLLAVSQLLADLDRTRLVEGEELGHVGHRLIVEHKGFAFGFYFWRRGD